VPSGTLKPRRVDAGSRPAQVDDNGGSALEAAYTLTLFSGLCR